MSLRLKIILAAEIGFLVPIGCFFVEMFFFSAKDRWWIDFLTFGLPVIVCPAWALVGGIWIIAAPLNAATYAGVAAIWIKRRKRSLRPGNI